MPAVVLAEGTGTQDNTRIVKSESEFHAALADSAVEVIQLDGEVELIRSADSKDNVFVIPRSVTITGGQLTLTRAGIVLGGDVTFDNVSIAFNTAVRNAIIANGHALTLNNVTCSGTYNIDIFCGGISDYNGGNADELSACNAGNAATITIQGINTFTSSKATVSGGNIYAGSLSDLGYKTEDETLIPDKANTYDGSAVIIIEKDATGVGEIYAHGAREDRSGTGGNGWWPNASLYKVNGEVSVYLKECTPITVHGATGGTSNARFYYTDDGSGYLCEPKLENVSGIYLLPTDNGQAAYLAPKMIGECSFAELSVPSNTKLSFENMLDAISTQNFVGGGILIFADDYMQEVKQELTITESISGNSKIAVGGIFESGTESTGVILPERTYIIVEEAAENSTYNFELLPYTNMVIKNDGNGNWITESTTIIESIQLNESETVSDEYYMEVPIIVDFHSEGYNSLGDIPMHIFVNGNETTREVWAVGYSYITGETNNNLAINFSYYEAENDDEAGNYVLVIENYDQNAIADGEYQISISIPGGFMSDGLDETINTTLTIGDYIETPADPYTIMNTDGITKEGITWYKSAITIQPASGYTIAKSKTTEFNATGISFSEAETQGDMFVYLKDDSGAITAPIPVTGVKVDATAPTGTISTTLGETTWNTFFDIVSFDTFTKEAVTVSITADDANGSGVKSIEYYIATKKLVDTSARQSVEEQIEAAVGNDWKTYSGAFSLNKNAKNIVYVKITDNVGNVTYLNSTGIVCYSESILEVTELSCVYGKNDVCSVLVYSNGNTLKSIKLQNNGNIEVLEENSDYNISMPASMEAADISIELTENWLSTLDAGTYTLIFEFAPLGIDTTAVSLIQNATLTIEKGNIPNWAAPTPKRDLVYDGESQLLVAGGTAENATWMYSLSENGIYTKTIPTQINAGEYTVWCYIEGGENYNDTEKIQIPVTIAQKKPDVGTVSANIVENSINIEDIVFTSSGTEIEGGFSAAEGQILVYGENEITYVFTPEDTTNYQSVEGKITITVRDTEAPVAQYQINSNGWNEFVNSDMNSITFGSFYKDAVTIEVQAEDTLSGVKTIEYFVSDEVLDDVSNAAWQICDETNKICIDTNGKHIVYVRVTDKAENIALEGFSTDGFVVYSESTVNNEVSYTYKSSQTVDIAYSANGNTVESITYNGTTLEEGTHYVVAVDVGVITLNSAWLNTLDAGEYELAVAFHPQGIETSAVSLAETVKLTVEKAALTIAGVTAADKVYDGKNTVAIETIVLSGIKELDMVSLDVSKLTGMVTSANAGMYDAVALSGFGTERILTGTDADNYQVIVPVGTVRLTQTVEIRQAVPSKETYVLDKSYVYAVESTERIDLAQYIPADGIFVGVSRLLVSGDITLTSNGVVIDEAGIVTYGVKKGTVGATGTIEFDVMLQNYTPIHIKIRLSMTDKYEVLSSSDVSLKSNTLYVGEALSKLEFNKITFTANGKAIEGTLAWEDASIVPTRGTTRATWVFTPQDTDLYQTVTGTIAITVAEIDISSASVILSSANFVYDGTAKTPTVTVKLGSKTLVSGTDYIVSYANNTAVGTATVTVTGKGNYSGIASKTFTIGTSSIAGASVILSSTSFVYDGTPKTPTVTVKLGSKTLVTGSDYIVSYANNTAAGTATVTVTGKGNYNGIASKTFTIGTSSIAGASVILSSTSYVYDGTAKTPTVTVKLGSKTLVTGSDYIVSYANNTAAGTATVTVTGKGNYSGIASKTFTIEAPSTEEDLNPTVKMGWVNENGIWYYYDNGIARTGWMNDNGSWYYMNPNGAMATGWVQDGNTWYYMNSSGVMTTGWLSEGGSWYYLGESGAMTTGWMQDGNAWYYMNPSGAMTIGWMQEGNTWYYMKSSGAMATGWVQDGNTWYYMNLSGAMMTGWVQDSDTWYYMNSSGAMMTGWVQDGDAWYYMDQSGVWIP